MYNYDQEIEKLYHPENFEPLDEQSFDETETINPEHLDACGGCSLCEA